MKKIGVVGAGLVGSCFEGLDEFEVVSHKEWKDRVWNWKGIVNCAAITGLEPCEEAAFDDVLKANVRLPIAISDYASMLQIPFFQFSTSAVYRLPSEKVGMPVNESDPLFPYNAYTASKIVMESTLPQSTYIFRIPVVSIGSGADNDLEQKVKRWTFVEDVLISIVYKLTLIEAVQNALNGTAPPGIYNIASESMHLPSYIKNRFDWKGEIVAANSLGRSPAIVLDTSKAKAHKLI